MIRSPYFLQECPVCGRPVRVRVEHLGRCVSCEHCHGRFVAYDPVSQGGRGVDRAESLLRMADFLLQQSTRILNRCPQAAEG